MTKATVDIIQKKIDKVEAKYEQLSKQAIRLKAKASSINRKREIKRNILFGICVQKLMKTDPECHTKMMEEMNEFLIDSRDRELFGLDQLL